MIIIRENLTQELTWFANNNVLITFTDIGETSYHYLLGEITYYRI